MLTTLMIFTALLTCPPSGQDGPPSCAYFGLEGRVCADWNEDGAIDPDDLGEFITDWEASSSCADIDLSGTVDVADLSEFLTAYFGS